MFKSRQRTWFKQYWQWIPLAVPMILLLLLGGRGGLGLNLTTALLCGALFAAWWLSRGLWVTAAVIMSLLLPGIADRAFRQPDATAAMSQLSAAPPAHIRIMGTIRRQEAAESLDGTAMRLLLGEAVIEHGGQSWPLAELSVDLPVRSRWYRFQGRRGIRIGGFLGDSGQSRGRLHLTLTDAEFHFAAREPGFAEYLRTELADRAGYYLHKPALAVYLPILLGVRDTNSPEARRVVSTFRHTGAAHLFAISGLHVGLLYLIFMLALHHAVGVLLTGQGLRYAREFSQIAVVAMIWLYLGLIGFPVSAVRAATMGTLFTWANLWGSRTPRFHILLITALAFLAVSPSQIYDLSFQLSFIAYGCLLFAFTPAAAEAPRVHFLKRWVWQVGRMMGFNLRITLLITLGTWPLISAAFGTISLLTFVANLLMVPLLSLVVLPIALMALLASLANLGGMAGNLAEEIAFGLLEVAIGGWLEVIQFIDRWGGALVFDYRLDWPAIAVIGYYFLVAAGIWWWWHRRTVAARSRLSGARLT